MSTELVRNWMTANPTVIPADTTLEQALHIMDTAGFRHLPIVSGDHLVSLISKSDIRRAELIIAASYNRQEMKELVTRLKTVSEIMSYRPTTVEADDPVSKAAGLLLEKHISALPVLENGRLTGIITESDVFRMVVVQNR